LETGTACISKAWKNRAGFSQALEISRPFFRGLMGTSALAGAPQTALGCVYVVGSAAARRLFVRDDFCRKHHGLGMLGGVSSRPSKS
jgi:hypothetical protein